MRQPIISSISSGLLLAVAIGGCGKIKEDKPEETAQTRAETKRHKSACASRTAYESMKRVIFDQARARQGSHRLNLDTLESFSIVRMEEPVVEGWDAALDITRCKGRFMLDVPPGAEQALGGERRLAADIAYTAQAAADASGLVYAISGAEPIVGKLAAFNVADATYRPLPALDTEAPVTEVARAEEPSAALRPDRPQPVPDLVQAPRAAPSTRPASSEAMPAPASNIAVEAEAERTVRSFYAALGAGDGAVASAQVIPAKRASRAYSADAISRFYGRLSDPLRLTSVQPLAGGAYRVSYRYAGTGVRCNGTATVRLTGGERPLIRSITAGNGC